MFFKTKEKILFFIFLAVDAALFFIVLHFVTRGGASPSFALFNPAGVIAAQQKNIIITDVGLMLIVAIPMLSFAGYVIWKYRATAQTPADFAPSRAAPFHTQLLWWLIPTIIIVLISLITWQSAHQLDPYKPLQSANAPITIQVVALEWKWLFIYPAQHIATVNFVEFPVNTPINFELTADAPMNSFWIPRLGSQIYAMAGMSTQLHLMATTLGDFDGKAVEINGKGFSGMRFIARSVSAADFNRWMGGLQATAPELNPSAYEQLTQPTTDAPPIFYGSVAPNLYDSIIAKYVGPAGAGHSH